MNQVIFRIKRLLLEGIKFYDDTMWFSNYNTFLCEAYGMGHTLVCLGMSTQEEFDTLFKNIKDEVLQGVLENGVEHELQQIDSVCLV